MVRIIPKQSDQRCESYQIGMIDGPNHTKTVGSKVQIVSNWYDEEFICIATTHIIHVRIFSNVQQSKFHPTHIQRTIFWHIYENS